MRKFVRVRYDKHRLNERISHVENQHGKRLAVKIADDSRISVDPCGCARLSPSETANAPRVQDAAFPTDDS